MAFTDAEKTQIAQYLGFPAVFQDQNPRLSGAIALVEADTEAATVVSALLVKLVAVETAIDTGSLATAGIASVGTGDPEFFEGGKIRDLRRIGRGLASKLSVKMGVPIVNDYFGEAGYSGDDWSYPPFQSGFSF